MHRLVPIYFACKGAHDIHSGDGGYGVVWCVVWCGSVIG